MNPCKFRDGATCAWVRELIPESTVDDATCERCQASGKPQRGNPVIEGQILEAARSKHGGGRDWSMQDLPCVRRGNAVRSVTCKTCGERGLSATVYKCDLYGECIRAATNNQDAPEAHCVTCEKRSQVVSVPCPILNYPKEYPTILIVMPAYQAARWIGQAIQSIIDQTFEFWELIVVDDGSTDDTFFIASAFAARDGRIRVMRQPNCGTGAALNAGFEAGKHSVAWYETWWSADSWMEPQMLGELVYALNNNPESVGFVYGDYTHFDDATKIANTVVTPEFDLHRHQSRCEVGIAWMWRKDVRLKCGPWEWDVSEDYAMWLKMADVTRFKRVPGVLGTWRQHDANLSIECQKNGWKASTQHVAKHKWRKAAIKVAYLCPWLDPAGVGWWLARGMNESRHSIAVRHIVKHRSHICQQDDLIIGHDDAEIRRVLEECDIIHNNLTFDFDLRPWIDKGKRIIHHGHGGVWTTLTDKVRELQEAGAKILSCEPGIKTLIPHAEYVFNPIPLDTTGLAWDGELFHPLPNWLELPFSVMCEHTYAGGKGTEAIDDALQFIRLKHKAEIPYSVVADGNKVIPIRQHIARKRQFPICIDNLTQGFCGMATWVSLAQGTACIARLDEFAIREYTKLGDGELPPIINVPTINHMIVELLDMHRNPDRLMQVRINSREWALKYYNQERLIGKWAAIYQGM